MISFKSTKYESSVISKIVARAMSLCAKHGAEYDLITCEMDITACHCSGMPLNLDALLSADDFDFFHDVLGIARHINRKTGQLEGCFVPRFALPVTA